MWSKFKEWIDLLAKLSAVIAVVIGSLWTLHLRQITVEDEINPEVWVKTEYIPYEGNKKLLVVHVTEKNVGKVPVYLSKDALTLTLKKLPANHAVGYVDTEKLEPLFPPVRNIYEKYGREVEIDAGTVFEDVATFVVDDGIYQVEAELSLGKDSNNEGNTVNGVAVIKVGS